MLHGKLVVVVQQKALDCAISLHGLAVENECRRTNFDGPAYWPNVWSLAKGFFVLLHQAIDRIITERGEQFNPWDICLIAAFQAAAEVYLHEGRKNREEVERRALQSQAQ